MPKRLVKFRGTEDFARIEARKGAGGSGSGGSGGGGSIIWIFPPGSTVPIPVPGKEEAKYLIGIGREAINPKGYTFAKWLFQNTVFEELLPDAKKKPVRTQHDTYKFGFNAVTRAKAVNFFHLYPIKHYKP